MYEFDFKSVFTLTSLMNHLNDVVKLKKSSQSFKTADVQHYITRGHLPRYLGGFVIKLEPSKAIGGRMGYKLLKSQFNV